MLAGALMSAVAVGLTYRLLGPAEPLARVIGRSMLSAAAIVTFALVGYTVWNAGATHTGPAVCIALAAVLAVLYRTYFLFLRQHADLTRMYSFGRQVTSVGSSIDDWQGVLEQVRDQLNAEVGVLRLNDGDTDGPAHPGHRAGGRARRADRCSRTTRCSPWPDHRPGQGVDRPQSQPRGAGGARRAQGLGRAGGAAALR